MIQHILIARAGPRDWSRADFIDERWHAHAQPTALANLAPDVVRIMSSNNSSPPDVTISAVRTVEELVRLGRPESFGISDLVKKSVIWARLGGVWSGDLWGEATFLSPGTEPVAGEKFTRPTLATHLKDALAALANDSASELWIRQGWTLAEIAPDLFPPEKWRVAQAEAAEKAASEAAAKATEAADGAQG